MWTHVKGHIDAVTIGAKTYFSERTYLFPGFIANRQSASSQSWTHKYHDAYLCTLRVK